jgi:hypothetical protein
MANLISPEFSPRDERNNVALEGEVAGMQQRANGRGVPIALFTLYHKHTGADRRDAFSVVATGPAAANWIRVNLREGDRAVVRGKLIHTQPQMAAARVEIVAGQIEVIE